MNNFIEMVPNQMTDLEIKERSSISSRIARACNPLTVNVPVTNVRHENDKTFCDINVSKLSTADKLLLGVC